MVNSNKIKCKPYDDLVDEAYSCYSAYMLDNQDLFGQYEHDETGEAVCIPMIKIIRIQKLCNSKFYVEDHGR